MKRLVEMLLFIMKSIQFVAVCLYIMKYDITSIYYEMFNLNDVICFISMCLNLCHNFVHLNFDYSFTARVKMLPVTPTNNIRQSKLL